MAETIKTAGGMEISHVVAEAKRIVGDKDGAKLGYNAADRCAAAALLVALDTRRLLDRLESAVENLKQ